MLIILKNLLWISNIYKIENTSSVNLFRTKYFVVLFKTEFN